MYQLVIIIVLLLLPSTATPEAGRGQLTIVVRDRAGQRLPGVQLALIHDADDGRVLIGEARTDAQGELRYPDLPWGLYLVQFRGTFTEQPLLPPARQNLGLLDDGSEASGGFGVRFAEQERTELFVLTSVPGEMHAVPMFDLAPSVQATPEPFAPLLAPARPALLPSPSHAPTLQASPPSLLKGLLWVIGIGVILQLLWSFRLKWKEDR